MIHEANLNLGIKATLAVTEVVKVLDKHRGGERQKVTVGQVNVQSGGQAIVGNVGPGAKREAEAKSALITNVTSCPKPSDEE